MAASAEINDVVAQGARNVLCAAESGEIDDLFGQGARSVSLCGWIGLDGRAASGSPAASRRKRPWRSAGRFRRRNHGSAEPRQLSEKRQRPRNIRHTTRQASMVELDNVRLHAPRKKSSSRLGTGSRYVYSSANRRTVVANIALRRT